MDSFVDYDDARVSQLTFEEAVETYAEELVVFAPMGTPTRPVVVAGPEGHEPAIVAFLAAGDIERFEKTVPRPFPTRDAGQYNLRSLITDRETVLLVESTGDDWSYTLISG